MLFFSVLLQLLLNPAFSEEPEGGTGDKEAVSVRVEKAHKRLEKHGGRDQYVTIFSDGDVPEDKKSFERPDSSIVLSKEDPSGLTWRSSSDKDEWKVVNRERKQRAKITKRLIIKGSPQEISEAYEFLKSDSISQGILGEKEDMTEANAAVIAFPKARFRELKRTMRSLKEKGFKVELELLNDRRFHAK